MDKHRRVDNPVFSMTKNACVHDILAYNGQERLPCMHDKQNCIMPQSSFDGASRKLAA